MLSFWPSLSLLVFFLVIFLECRTIAGRVTLPFGSFLMVFCYGSIGAPLLALLFQQIPIFPAAGADAASPIAWLVGPPIEELAKALPVIVLAFLTRESRRLSIADLTLVGFASGSGFGFVEGNLNALVNGALPSVQHLAALGLQSENGAVFFAGHPVSTALVGLAAGIGMRFLPLKSTYYAWAPAAFMILWASFDHGLYNWKILHAANNGVLPAAHFAVELLHTLTLHGQLATWLLVFGLIAGQFFEAYLCSKAVGVRRDLLLAREWRPWVINEWLVVLLRAPLGRAVFGQTLAYFRLRRAFYLAAFEARRDPGDPTWSRHARSLEERLKRERSMLFDPPSGAWLLPLPVLQTYAAQWTWRMRWVLLFAVLLFFSFMLDPGSMPEWLRQFLFGKVFATMVVIAGLGFAVWRIFLFARQPPPDPLAAEGTAFTSYYTRQLLLGCSLLCGLFPTLAILFGWKLLAPGAAFISGYLPGWIGQGGNLQTLLGLGAIGSAVAPDPRPAGEAFRHEIAAGEERIRRLGWDIEDKTGAAGNTSLGTAPPVQLNGFLDAMAKLDAERDAQARRQLALDECERLAGEATLTDPAPTVQAVKDEFDHLAGELLEAAAKELDAIASLEQAYGRAWSEIMQDLDAHDVLRRRLRDPLRQTWDAQNDIAWALRVVEATDEGLLPMQLTLLPELHALAATARNARADKVAAGVERIRAAAAAYGEADPFAFAGTDQADGDEAALLGEFASTAPPTDTPKPFGLRAPQPVEAPAQPADDKVAAKAEPSQPATSSPVQSRGQHYQDALDQLLDTTSRDARYLETIRHLESTSETLRQPIEPDDAKPQSSSRGADKAAEPSAHPAAELPAAATREHQNELKDLLDAIKRDSGYLVFSKDTQAPHARDERDGPPPAASTPTTNAPAQAVAQAADDATEAAEHKAPTADKSHTADEPVAASIAPEITAQPEQSKEAVAAPPAELAAAATVDAKPREEAAVEALAEPDMQPAEPDVPSGETPRAKDAHAEAPEPQRTEDTGSTAKRIDQGEAERPTAIEPQRPTVEAKKPLEREPAAQAEISSSLFSKLFQSVRQQSADTTAKPVRWDQRPEEPATKPIDAEPAKETAPQPEQREPEPQKSSSEIAAPAADWLADFAALKPTDVTAQGSETPLEPIEWPALNQSADDNVPAQTLETTPIHVEVATPVEAPSDVPQAANTDAIAPLDAAAVAADAVKPVESQAPEPASADAPVADEATQPLPGLPNVAATATDIAPEATSAPARKPAGADEFESKVDRLSQLLEKLEQAMQAKTAAPSAPSEERAAAVADAAPSTPPSVADRSSERTPAPEPSIIAEPPMAEHPPSADQPPQTDQHVPAPLAETQAAPAEPTKAPDAQPVNLPPAVETRDRAADTAPVSTPPERQEPPEAPLKPERLSFLLTKLFEAAKRESAEQAVKPQQADPEPLLDEDIAPPAEGAAQEPLREILDLNGPNPLPEPVEDAVDDAKPAEASEPVASQPQPVAPEAAPAQPSSGPIEPRTRPRTVERTAFGSRSKAPRPAAPPLMLQPKAKPSAPERSAELAAAETPSTTPKRDWKLGNGNTARGENPKAAEAESKSEPAIRVKTGSGALATADTPLLGSSAASANTPGKYYGPRHAKFADDEPQANVPAQQRALSLADALSEHYSKTGQPQPPMYTTDRMTLQRIMTSGRLEAPLRRGAPWSTSGMSRRGEVVIRLKPGAEQFIEFVPSKELFGQIPHYYPRGVGKGSYATHIPATHLEHFDLTHRHWVPLVGG